jgi:hypothetical protein
LNQAPRCICDHSSGSIHYCAHNEYCVFGNAPSILALAGGPGQGQESVCIFARGIAADKSPANACPRYLYKLNKLLPNLPLRKKIHWRAHG